MRATDKTDLRTSAGVSGQSSKVMDLTYQSSNDDTGGLQTITLSQKDVRAAARVLKVLAAGDDPLDDILKGAGLAGRSDIGDRQALVGRARQAFLERRRRDRLFGQSMAGEPAWDMLLALYIADVSEARFTLGKLIAHSGVAPSTAHRWLDYLVNRGLVGRKMHPTDRRTVFVELTDEGRSTLDMYFSGTAGAQG